MDDLRAPEVYEFGEFLLDTGQRLLRTRVDGEPIALTSKAFETLLHLVEHRGELVDKTTLMKAVWPNVVIEENNLNQAISALRKALGESPVDHRFIVTVPGRGYRFVAPVRPLDGNDPTATTVVAEQRAAVTEHAASTINWRVWAIPPIAVLLAAALWFAWGGKRDVAPADSSATAAQAG